MYVIQNSGNQAWRLFNANRMRHTFLYFMGSLMAVLFLESLSQHWPSPFEQGVRITTTPQCRWLPFLQSYTLILLLDAALKSDSVVFCRLTGSLHCCHSTRSQSQSKKNQKTPDITHEEDCARLKWIKQKENRINKINVVFFFFFF